MEGSTVQQRFEQAVDIVFARVTDPAFLKRRAEAAGEQNVVVDVDRDGDRLTIRIERDVERKLPGFMKKVFAPTNHFIDVQIWSTAGAVKSSAWTVQIVGQKRIALGGHLALTASAAGGCNYAETFTAAVSIPLIGGRVAKYVVGETEAGIRRQIEFLRTDLG